MKKQFNLFLLSLSFFSRIPVPSWVDYSPENLNRASRYFTLVGALLGSIVAFVFLTTQLFFPTTISLWIAMIISLLLTGCFHEDGLADTADGLGGAFERDKKLAIMKDSRIGTYGASALLISLLGKYVLLLESHAIVLALIVAYPVSRAVAGSLIYTLPYVSDSDTSKSKPLANHQSTTDLTILCLSALPFIGLLLIFADVSFIHILGFVLALILIRQLAAFYLLRQLGGYTGDNLGAVQQVTELSIYLLFGLMLS